MYKRRHEIDLNVLFQIGVSVIHPHLPPPTPLHKNARSHQNSFIQSEHKQKLEKVNGRSSLVKVYIGTE